MKNLSSSYFKALIKHSKVEEGVIQAPISDQAFAALNAKCQDQLGFRLPDSYLELLKIINGYSGFNFMLYADQDVYMEKLNQSWLYGILDININYVQSYPKLIALGESGDSYLMYDTEQVLYKNIERFASNINAEFNTLSELLDYTIAPLIEGGGE